MELVDSRPAAMATLCGRCAALDGAFDGGAADDAFRASTCGAVGSDDGDERARLHGAVR